MIINPTAVIGNNCNLSQFVTIGAIDGNAAEIGDNVYIGPNCCLIENVRIGNNVTIGPILLGAAKPVHILTPTATTRRVVNMTALTVAEIQQTAQVKA